jgi:molecular chaperone HtpG
MTEAEIRENLGRIAHSGTKQFRQAMDQKADLIGQFGVGFYSAFIVADRVIVESCRAGTSEGVRWESDGKGTFSVEAIQRPQGFGTSITLHLKPADNSEEGGLADFSDEYVLRNTIKTHSDFISYPIVMETEKKNDAGEVTKEEVTVNSQKALWVRSPAEVTEEEHAEFYRHIAHDFSKPLKTIHYRAEGTIEFHALVYLPEQRPWNFDYEGSQRGLSLYVKRVLIMSDCEELLPSYLRFVRGVVDSSDLSLNVSREILQKDRQVMQIRKALTTKVLKVLADMLKDDRATYEKFWDNFGAILKEGMVREADKKDTLLPLFLFHSTRGSEMTSLSEYVGRMPADQKEIYYITGESLDLLRTSPLLERLKSKGFEVLLMAHPVDEFMSPRLDDFNGKKFRNIGDADFDLATEDERKVRDEELKQKRERLGGLIDTAKEALSDRVRDVQLSSRLTDSVCCLVSDGGNHHYLEQLYRQMGKEAPPTRRVMELNPDHPLVERMQRLPKETQRDWAELLYYQALISEGSRIPDPTVFVKKMTQMMVDASPSSPIITIS